MRKNLLYTVAAVMMISCGGQKTPQHSGNGNGKQKEVATDPAKTTDSYIPQRSDYSFRTEVRTIHEDDEVHWDTIIVYLTDGKGRTHELYTQATPLDTVYWSKSSIGTIEEEDWNFDGFPDLQVCQGPTNGSGNDTYDVWLWNDKAHQFEKLDYEGLIFSPFVDSENKCIVSTWHLDDDIQVVKYQWIDGQLVETERE